VSTGLWEGGGLPAERRELASARDRDHPGRLATLPVQDPPALVESPLSPPGHRNHARVLAVLAFSERVTDSGMVAVVVGGFDEQSAGVPGSGLGDRALPAFGVRGSFAGDDAKEP
jgi:hypothetical protein